MTDIEFDEIDKAVSSAMSPPPKKDPSEAKPAEEVGGPEQSSSPASERSAVKPTRETPVVKRSGGRFMDVVHPSSDMKTASKKTVQPLNNSSETKPEPTEQPVDSYPDPIDFEKQRSEEESSSKLDNENQEASSPDEEPAGTPFLSDTKVEKRPLGAYSSAQAQQAETKDRPIESDTPLPEELQGEVLSIETNESIADTPVSGQVESDMNQEISDNDRAEAEPKKEEPEAKPAEEEKEEPEAKPEPDEKDKKDEPAPPVPSIVQQYQEKQSSAQSESGAIFDTEHYHQPLAHTPKKKGGWLVVLWILILIIVGGALGAAAYYFVLPEFL